MACRPGAWSPIVPAPAGQRIGVARGAFEVPDTIDASNAERRPQVALYGEGIVRV
jgi:hypothetical protein